MDGLNMEQTQIDYLLALISDLERCLAMPPDEDTQLLRDLLESAKDDLKH